MQGRKPMNMHLQNSHTHNTVACQHQYAPVSIKMLLNRCTQQEQQEICAEIGMERLQESKDVGHNMQKMYLQCGLGG